LTVEQKIVTVETGFVVFLQKDNCKTKSEGYIMLLSGLLLYGASQKNRKIAFGFFAVLFLYLLSDSRSIPFFLVNISVIFGIAFILGRLNCHALSGMAILMYSVVIDIVSFYFFPLFPITVSLPTYILAGLLFNIRSALPAMILGMIVQIVITVHFFKNLKTQKTQKAAVQPLPILIKN